MTGSHYHWRDGTLVLQCHVQPGASASEWCGIHGERLKVRVKAPPAEGRANHELLRFVAAEFGVATGQVTLLAGASARKKTIAISSPRRFPPDVLVPALPGTA